MVKKLNFDYKECLKKGLLRKIPKSKAKSEKSIRTALEECKQALKTSKEFFSEMNKLLKIINK